MKNGGRKSRHKTITDNLSEITKLRQQERSRSRACSLSWSSWVSFIATCRLNFSIFCTQAEASFLS